MALAEIRKSIRNGDFCKTTIPTPYILKTFLTINLYNPNPVLIPRLEGSVVIFKGNMLNFIPQFLSPFKIQFHNLFRN
jgi:hypothetical protein